LWSDFGIDTGVFGPQNGMTGHEPRVTLTLMERGLTAEVLELARGAGASAVGVTSARPFPEARKKLMEHRATGESGPLRFTYDDPEVSTDVRRSHPWARSLVTVGRSYIGEAVPPANTGPVIGRFATADHYAAVRRVVEEVARYLEDAGHRAACLVDDNGLVDRSAAARAGIGWLGRNTMLLTPGPGPWMLLGSVATDAPLESTDVMRRDCGACAACLPACPTGALSDRGLDARRCISTWLQSPGSIPHWIRPKIGRRIYGCDDCLTACPPGARALGASRVPESPSTFGELLEMTDDELVRRFHWWYIPRRQGRYIRRNLLIAAGNSGEPEAAESIGSHLGHVSSMIRGVAAWGFARNLGEMAAVRLETMLGEETIPETIAEIELALEMVRFPDRYAARFKPPGGS